MRKRSIANQDDEARHRTILSWRARRRIRAPSAMGEGANKSVSEVAYRTLIVDRRSIVRKRGLVVLRGLWVMILISKCKGRGRFILRRRNVSIRRRLQSRNGDRTRSGS